MAEEEKLCCVEYFLGKQPSLFPWGPPLLTIEQRGGASGGGV